MKCWICSRQARGFGHTEIRHRVGDPRRYPLDWVFCSRRCQEAFHKCYGSWTQALDQGATPEAAMVDVTPLEKAALRACLKPFGEAANAIGFDKPLGAYSEGEALSVIDAIVTGYVQEMAAQHERSAQTFAYQDFTPAWSRTASCTRMRFGHPANIVAGM